MNDQPRIEMSPKVSDEIRQDHLLHVRLPLRHQRASEVGQGVLYRGEPGPSDQQGCPLRQGRERDHAGDGAVASARAIAAGGA